MSNENVSLKNDLDSHLCHDSVASHSSSPIACSTLSSSIKNNIDSHVCHASVASLSSSPIACSTSSSA